MSERPTAIQAPVAGTQALARPSIKDVASRADVSVGTVSNVLNRPDAVSEPVRLRVQSAIAELGYIRNATAQSLRIGTRQVVGVAVLDIDNPFFTAAASGMERRLRTDGLVMILSSTHADPGVEARLLRTLEEQNVRGILLTPTDPELAEALAVVGRGTPVVLFDEPAAPPELSSVFVDDHAGAAMAIDHLLQLGHRSIAFVNGPSDVRQARSRLAGVRDAVAAHPAADEIELTVHAVDAFTMPAGRQGAQWLAENLDTFPTAVFCANDLMAIGAIGAIESIGLKVPGDVSVIGFDDIAIAEQFSVPLTTIRQPMAELGWAAADLLLTGDGPARHRRFHPELIVRRSTARPRLL